MSDVPNQLEQLSEQVASLIKQKGPMRVAYDEGGGGMGFCYCATIAGKWPYCHHSTLEGALRVLVSEHLRLEREALQKRITEIDNSAAL